MSQPASPEIADLFGATDPPGRSRAWSRFLERHSGLLMQAARSFGPTYDEAMDRYRYLVEELERDDFRRLRAYSPAGPGKFSTWLVVVAQRLCQDYHRKRYGRLRALEGERSEAARARKVRWRLQELVAESLDPALSGNHHEDDAELAMRKTELGDALGTAMGTLDRRDRLLLRYRFEDDRSISEIADLMHFPSVFHVYRRLRKLMGDLRGKLERRGVHDPLP